MKTRIRLEMPSDLLSVPILDSVILFPAPPGNPAWTGKIGQMSDFIKCLTEVIEKFGSTEDFMTMVERVTRKTHELPKFLAGLDGNTDWYKHCPYSETTMTKKLFFVEPLPETDHQNIIEELRERDAKQIERILQQERKITEMKAKLAELPSRNDETQRIVPCD